MRVFLVLISTDSSDAARWLRNELGVALALEEAKVGAIRIIPPVSEPAALPVQLRDRFYVDLRKGYFSSLFRVAATIYDCSLADVDAVLEGGRLRTRLDCLEQLRGLGVDVWTLLERGDFEFFEQR